MTKKENLINEAINLCEKNGLERPELESMTIKKIEEFISKFDVNQELSIDDMVIKKSEIVQLKNEKNNAEKKLIYHINKKKQVAYSKEKFEKSIIAKKELSIDEQSKLDNFNKEIEELDRIIASKSKIIENIPNKISEIEKELFEFGKKEFVKLLKEKTLLEQDKFDIVEKELYPILLKLFDKNDESNLKERKLLEDRNKISSIYPQAVFSESNINSMRRELGIDNPKLTDVKRRQALQYINKGFKYLDLQMKLK